MTIKEQIMKLQTYKMYEGEDTVYVERDDVLKLLEQQSRDCKSCKHSNNGKCAYTEECHECMWENKYEQQPCEDAISRQAVLNLFNKSDEYRWETTWIRHKIEELPSITPKFTDTEIQKMQELEQAQLDKAYELGKAEMQPCEDCISRTELLSRIDAERKHLLDLKMDGAEHILVHHARRIIEDMPSVTSKASED